MAHGSRGSSPLWLEKHGDRMVAMRTIKHSLPLLSVRSREKRMLVLSTHSFIVLTEFRVLGMLELGLLVTLNAIKLTLTINHYIG